MNKCSVCPRECGVNRSAGVGFCGVGEEFFISRIMAHRGEEPVISGTRGSGAVFFGGCNLRCVYCQNYEISRGGKGETFSFGRLEKAVFELIEQGVHNIDFITATHYADRLARFLEKTKPKIPVPIVYNCGGYESAEALKKLNGLIDVYLPDFKYVDVEIARKYSSAPDYPTVAENAIKEMVRQRGKAVIKGGIMQSGVIIRHLVLPSARKNGIDVMRVIAEKFPSALVSIMRQYTPEFNRSEYKELSRRITAFEYESVVNEAVKLGLNGFTQNKGCANPELTPSFDEIF